MAISTEDNAILAQQDMHTLAKWWCLLNGWGWPDDLPDPEGEEYTRGCRRSRLMNAIEDMIGFRQCLRQWNHGLSDEEFNDLWRGHFEGHAPSRERNHHRLMESVRSRVRE